MNDNTHVWLRGLPKELQGERILDFKNNKVQYLTLNQLRETVDERNTGQRPINGMLHYVLFQNISNMLDNAKLKYELKPIAATDGGPRQYPGVITLPGFIDQHGEGSLQSHLLRRLMGLFTIKGFGDKNHSTGLAVAFHQDGIQIGFGPNVDACANLCILGAEMRMQTYGSGKIKIEKMLEVVSDWVTNIEGHMKRQMAVLKHFEETMLRYRDVAELVGHMNFIRVGRDAKGIDSKNEYPLNQGHISKFTEDYLLKYQDLCQNTVDPEVSLLDLYNLGTNLHKPENTEIPLMIGNNTALGSLFIDKFVPEELKTQLQ